MEFRLLGPVEIRVAGRPVSAGQPRQRAVLAALLVDAGRLVPFQVLADRVWGDGFDGDARGGLHTYTARIRRLLSTAQDGEDAATSRPVRLRHEAGGYLLDADPDRVDLHRLRGLADRAREPGRPDAERAQLLREAVAQWRGEPLTGVAGDWAVRMRRSWEQERMALVVAWADAELRLGNAVAALGPLDALAGEHPTAEPVAATLMRALTAVGRPADALHHYARMRRTLAEELGVDPGPELQAVHQAVLRGEAAAPPSPPAVAGGIVPVRPANVRPAQLPADVPGFVGREGELAALDAVLGAARAAPTAVVISAIAGTAGVGKTALAVRWAHLARDRFPDGQLYVNLRGYDPDQPLSPGDALAGFLSALGVPAAEVPLEVADRAARYRTELAGRRLLIVLDNASAVEQVRPLLPGSPSCAVLVTSRDALAGLVARDGARRVDLDLLPSGDAVTLLRSLIGPAVEEHPAAADALIRFCARLPLALRVAAELAAARPGTSLPDLVAELGDRRLRLDLLDAGEDPRAAVRAVFSWSVRHLDPDAARAFATLGLHPGPDYDVYSVAALTGLALPPARRALDRLARANLVQVTGPGRYGMHDLLHDYAAELAAGDAVADRAAAVGRYLDHCVGTAALAMDRLYPAEAARRPAVPVPDTPVPPLADADAARDWLDRERAGLVAASALAAESSAGHAVRLSAILYRYLDGGHHADALAIHEHARAAAERSGDAAGQGQAELGLGGVHWRLGRHWPAAQHYERALALFRTAGDRVGEARALGNLGAVHERLGHYEQAAGFHEESLALHAQGNDPVGQAIPLSNLGILYERLGRYARAVECHQQVHAVFRRAGDAVGQAWALNNLGTAEQRLGRPERAAASFEEALTLFRSLGNAAGEAMTLDNVGTLHTQLGRPGRATERHQQALALYRDLGQHSEEAAALNGLGEAAHAAGRPGAALAYHREALAIAVETGFREEQARGHGGLGHAHRALGDPVAARDGYERAAQLYADLGMPQAETFRTELTAVAALAARAGPGRRGAAV